MKISDKLAKVNNTFTVTKHDNGFVFSVSGTNNDGNWAETNILCTGDKSGENYVGGLGDIYLLIDEYNALPRSE